MPAVKEPEGMNPGLVDFSEGVDDESVSKSCTPSKARTGYSYGNAFWSINVGPLHLISLNCYSVADSNSHQYNWLVDDLYGVNRSTTPFVVVVEHCPWYSSSKVHYNEWQAAEMREALESVLNEFKVDLVLAGHVHACKDFLIIYFK